jgi:Tfp pilus assembly protein PilX
LISGSGMTGADPQFVVEELEEVPDSLGVPPTGPPPSRIYYRITSAAQGGSQQAQVVLQSTFARRF